MGGVTWTYTYDANGMRTSRSNGTTTYNYVYTGDKLTRMTIVTTGSTQTVDISYDASGTPLTLTYTPNGSTTGTTYYYVTNIQGDVTGLTDTTGELIISYFYTGYGETYTIKHNTEQGNILSAVNPLCYRGYVLDTQTKLYYLQSRYYNPEIGRFINADMLVSTGQGLLGNNMFAYCLNNPVNYSDPTGLCSRDTSLGILIDCGSDWCSESYNGFLVRRYFGNAIGDLVEDYFNYNPNNESEDVALASHYFSSYNGVLVIRTDGDRSGSLGIIFLTRETNSRDFPQDIVRHEYGHVVQLKQVGLFNYLLGIGLPSWRKWESVDDYYSARYEITADILGGVESRIYTTAEYYTAFSYLKKVDRWGIFAWLDLL